MLTRHWSQQPLGAPVLLLGSRSLIGCGSVFIVRPQVSTLNTMKTITEHLDDLDRMVDAGNTPKHELRSQIAFIGREVAALEANHHAAIEAAANEKSDIAAKYKKLQSEHEKPNPPRPEVCRSGDIGDASSRTQ